MKLLFLNPPFTKRYDSAGARFASTRRSRSMWYPVWLAHAAALCGNDVDLLDGPAEDISAQEAVRKALDYDCVVFYTSAPSFKNDSFIAQEIKRQSKRTRIVFTGPYVSALPAESLTHAPWVDAVTVGEFDYTVKEIHAGVPFDNIAGLVWRNGEKIEHNSGRPPVENLDSLPFVSPIYKKYLPIRRYYLPFALHPYISIYSGRGCPYQCSFCLWPQTFTGRTYRKRSIANIIEEVRYIQKELPQVKEIFFDDDTFSVDKKWVEEFCDAIEPLKVCWSFNARADIPLAVLQRLKRAGCRLLVVGYESGNQKILDNVHKGISVQQLTDFTRDCNEAGIMIHGTFVLGLPGETLESIRQTIDFAKKLRLDTVQCSLISPLPGTELYEEMLKKGYLNRQTMVTEDGFQSCPVQYPGLSNQVIEASVNNFHREFYIRPHYFLRLLSHVAKGPAEARRVFSIGKEYLQFVFSHGHF